MIKYTKGDILQSSAEAIVNCVNCQGHMGAGLAAQFREKYSEMNKKYQIACYNNEVRPGKHHYWQNSKTKQWVVNFVTKDLVKNDSEYTYITMGLQSLLEWLEDNKIKSIALPKLGAGLGNLDWEIVDKMICKAFKNYDGECIIYK